MEKRDKNAREHLNTAKEEIKSASTEAMGRAKTEVTGKIEDAKGIVNEVIGKAAEKVLEQVAEVDPATKQ